MSPEALAVLVPIVALIGGLTIAGVAIYFRYRATELRHRERMAAIEKGIDLPAEPEMGRNKYLLKGLKGIFVGIGLTAFFVAMSRTQHDFPAGLAPIGLIPIGIGIAHLIVYWVQGKQESQTPPSHTPFPQR